MPRIEVLVVGATGSQGSGVAHALLQAGFPVRALTRNLAHPVAESLRLRGARLAWSAIEDTTRLAEAMVGVGAVFAVTSAAAGAAAETTAGLALIEMARQQGVQHFVYSSLIPAITRTGFSHFDSKHEIEQYLHASGMPYTVICPAFFMETLLTPEWRDRLKQGELPLPWPAYPLQQIARADVARFARSVLQNRDMFAGRRISLASEEQTGIEMAATLARVIGRRITVVDSPADGDLPLPWSRAALDHNGTEGRADVDELRAEYPEVNWHTLDGWARRQDWSVLDS